MKKVLLVLNQKGGAGKTTLCINLARTFSELNNSTAIIDTDLQGTCQLWYKESEKNKFFDVFVNDGNVKRTDINALSQDIIIIDTPPRLNANNKVLIELSDYVILPSAPTSFDLWATQSTINFLLGIRPDIKIIVVVNNINQNRSNIEFDLKELLSESYKNIYICDSMIYRRNAYILEPNVTVLERKDYKAKREITILTQEILTYIGIGE